jgi:hypothetical protein
MKRIAVVLAAIGLMASYVVAEDLSDPPWDMTLPFQSAQTWDFPSLLTGMPHGEVVPDLPMFPFPGDADNPFGEPWIEWPSGEYLVEDEGGVPEIVTVVVTVENVPYTNPDGTVTPDTPTTHIGVYGPDGLPDTSRTVPVRIWIPNNKDDNLVKKIQWQVTSDKSPTPQGNSPTTEPPGTSGPGDPPQIEHGDGSSGWITYNGLNEIRPNPDGEWLEFGLVHCTNIEEIVIKTICMPEPATLGLLAAGGLLTLVRRKRR